MLNILKILASTYMITSPFVAYLSGNISYLFKVCSRLVLDFVLCLHSRIKSV